jgi:hypothetical protein
VHHRVSSSNFDYAIGGPRVQDKTSLAVPAQSRLILQITVDALRGDLPQRFAHVLGESGLRYLMELECSLR